MLKDTYTTFCIERIFAWLSGCEEEDAKNVGRSNAKFKPTDHAKALKPSSATPHSFFQYLPSKRTLYKVAEAMINQGIEVIDQVPTSKISYMALGIQLISMIKLVSAKTPISLNYFKGKTKTAFCYARYFSEAIDYSKIKSECQLDLIDPVNCNNKLQEYTALVGNYTEVERQEVVAALWSDRNVTAGDKQVVDCFSNFYKSNDTVLLLIFLGIIAALVITAYAGKEIFKCVIDKRNSNSEEGDEELLEVGNHSNSYQNPA